MNSDYCYTKEMMQALERHKRGEARVIPIILRHVYWQGVLGNIQALPRNARPVKSWPDQDEAFLNVAEGIRKVVKELQGQLTYMIKTSVFKQDKDLKDSDVAMVLEDC